MHSLSMHSLSASFALLSCARRLRRAHAQELPLLPGNSGGFDELGLGPLQRDTSKSCEGVRSEDRNFRPSGLKFYAHQPTPRGVECCMDAFTSYQDQAGLSCGVTGFCSLVFLCVVRAVGLI